MAFSLFNKKDNQFLSPAEKEQIVEAIRQAESRTSGEIRIYIEKHCKFVNPLDRATEIFFNLKMDQTKERNAVLMYVASAHRQLAIFGDEGIYQKAGKPYWDNLVSQVLQSFNETHFVEGICHYIHEIGEGLSTYFPYDHETDHNELPDDLVFGK